MLELVSTRAGVVVGVASAAAIDGAMALPGAFRIAPDELMVVGAPDESGAATDAVRATLVAADPDAVAVDASDGWAVWSLRGDDAPRMFDYLAAFPLPEEGLAQGDVARVPVRVLVSAPDAIHLLVPAMWAAYLRERVLERGRVLLVRAVDEPEGWPV